MLMSVASAYCGARVGQTTLQESIFFIAFEGKQEISRNHEIVTWVESFLILFRFLEIRFAFFSG